LEFIGTREPRGCNPGPIPSGGAQKKKRRGALTSGGWPHPSIWGGGGDGGVLRLNPKGGARGLPGYGAGDITGGVGGRGLGGGGGGPGWGLTRNPVPFPSRGRAGGGGEIFGGREFSLKPPGSGGETGFRTQISGWAGGRGGNQGWGGFQKGGGGAISTPPGAGGQTSGHKTKSGDQGAPGGPVRRPIVGGQPLFQRGQGG